LLAIALALEEFEMVNGDDEDGDVLRRRRVVPKLPANTPKSIAMRRVKRHATGLHV